MTDTGSEDLLRCTRCGREAGAQDKFCAECGMFLRDAFVDERLLLALHHEKEGHSRDARHELERLLDDDCDLLEGSDDECEEFEVGPFLLELPLDGTVDQARQTTEPLLKEFLSGGTYA